MRRQLVGFIAALSVGPFTSASELVNGSFEDGSSISLPTGDYQVGVWGGNLSEVVTAGNGIVPPDGSMMLQFIGGSQNGPGGTTCLVAQVIDLSDEELERDTVATMTGLFNRVTGNAETDTQFDIGIAAFAGTVDSLPQQWPRWLDFDRGELFTDADQSTWERATASLVLPDGTGFLVVWLSAVENVHDDLALPEFDGHFADAVAFGLNVVPCFDIDGDDIVGTSDLLILLAQWGPCPPKCFGDLDGDGVVGTSDLLELLANWGPC